MREANINSFIVNKSIVLVIFMIALALLETTYMLNNIFAVYSGTT